ncbi:MAG TPA: penicillin-binding protein 2 [Burkholderiales bacterium]
MLNIPLKDYLRETRIFNTRLGWAGVGVVLLVLVLLVRIVWLQVIEHRHYATLSQANRVKPIPVPPARGLIFDRNGVVLAQNFPVYTLEIVPEQVKDMDALIAELRKLVRITDGDEKSFEKLVRERPRFESIPLRSHLNEDEAARIAVRLPLLQGVELRARLQRHYPLGGLAVHALGYVGRISEQDLERIDRTAYRGLQHIGKLGIEYAYEDLLVGRVGVERVETNAHGRSLRTLERVAPVAGRNLYLNIDAKVQAVAEQALAGHRGAVVAIEPATGAVLAFASTPTFDGNAFVNGIDPASYRALLDDPDKPLINRALHGQYAPGSTIKAFFGLADLEAGSSIDMNRHVYCTGSFSLPGSSHQFRDWKREGHGLVTRHEAIVQSCDVYFYRLAVALGPDRMADFLAPFGFGQETGIDLPEEKSGLLPSPAWKRKRGQPWYPGDTVVAGIGQGLILVTPLQLAVATATIANRGLRTKPMLVRAHEDPITKERVELAPRVVGRVPVRNARHWDALFADMMAVVHGERGTARGIGRNAPYHIAGKTGTAQVRSIAQGARYDEKNTPERFRDHALFIAFAPVESPQIAVAVVVENGGSGSGTAAPIARRVLDEVILGGPAPARPRLAVRASAPPTGE